MSLAKTIPFSIILLFCFLLVVGADARVTRQTTNSSDFCESRMASLNITGEITNETAKQIKKHLPCRTEKVTLIVLQSRGGSVQASIDIAHFLRTTAVEEGALIRTVVPRDAVCSSSCALIFAAGPKKENYGRIGLHRPYFTRSQGENLESAWNQIRDQLESFVREFGLSQRFLDAMLLTKPDDMKIFYGDQIFKLVPRQDPLLEASGAEKQAGRYGITPGEYRKRKSRAEQKCGESPEEYTGTSVEQQTNEDIAAWGACWEATKWGVPLDLYTKRFDALQECRDQYDNFTSARTNCMKEVLE